jgi:hypoxanthine phosphoribosyltransferase
MPHHRWYDADIERVIITEDQIRDKTTELAKQVAVDYQSVDELLLICVLKGAVMFVADFARELGRCGPPLELEFLTASSYGQGTTSSGVVRLRSDLGRDIAGKHVLVVEDIIDSGLTLSWLLKNLTSRAATSVEVVTLFRKPAAVKSAPPLKYVGFDIPTEFVVGYGLDYAERYRELPYVGILKPEVYTRSQDGSQAVS